MKTITIYRENKSTGTVEKIEVQGRRPVRSYDADIDLPFHQRVLNGYRDLESRGELKWDNSIGSKSHVRRIHEEALAREST